MQFSVAAVALLAAVASAGSTLYVTDVVTITSCAPTVTNCPARSTVTSTTSYLRTTTAAPVYQNTTVPALPSTKAPVVPSVPVSLSTEYITTCIPTVITKVHTVSPTSTPVYTPPPTTVKPTGTGVVSPYPTFTGAASHVKGSMYAAGLGLAAFFLA